MSKFILRLSVTTLLTLSLITSSVLAFHKDGEHSKNIDAIEGLKKKDVQSEYCTSGVKLETIKNKKPKAKEKKEEAKKEKTIEEQFKELQEASSEKKPESLVEEKKFFKITNYHSGKTTKAPKELDISILIDMEKISIATSMEQLFQYYCLQPSPIEDNTKKFKYSKKTDISKLYDEIAINNGLVNKDSKVRELENITKTKKINIDVGRPLIISEAQFIIVERQRLKNEEKKAAEEKKKQEELAKQREAEKDWIAKNKPPLLDAIDKKISKFDDQIEKINNDYTQLKIDYENFVNVFKEKKIEVEDLLEDADRTKKEIKDKAKDLRKNGREYLNSNILDDFKSKFKKTKKVKESHYENYQKLEDLRKAVNKSEKRRHFKEGGIIFKKIGFFTQWERLKDVELNDKQQGKIDTLSKEITEAEKNITNSIDTLIVEIQTLEEELSNKLPIMEIGIGFVVFLIICGVGYFVYDTSQKRKREKEESESKIESLKSDFEDKFKDTSEQIRKVGRRGQTQSSTTESAEPVVEKPKTQEEIIASKYDELLSDYKDSLDDFSKVAGFKQKWNGLALSRKERQDGTKTILINSTRAFEKAEIWCVNFSDKYFAFPGSSVKSNMAAYMNLDFEKASRDFKGAFAISSGSSYSTEPAVLRRGGAGFVVERIGKLIFPT